MCRLSGPTGRFGSEQSDSQRDQCCCPDERMDAFSFRHLLSSFLLGLISFGGSATGRSAPCTAVTMVAIRSCTRPVLLKRVPPEVVPSRRPRALIAPVRI